MGWGNFINNVGITTRVWRDIDRENEDREYLKEQRKLTLERGRADNELLSDRNASQRAQYGLSAEQATAERDNVGQVAALRGVQAKNALAQAQGENADMGTTLAAQSAQRKSALAQAEYQLGTDKFNLDELPSKLTAMRQQGAIDDVARSQHVLAGLHTALQTKNPQLVLSYVNKALAEGDGKQFDKNDPVVDVRTDTAPLNGQQVDVLVLRTGSGKNIVIPRGAIESAYAKVNPPKVEKMNPGDVLTARPADGGPVTEVYRAPKWEKLGEDGGAIEVGSGEIKPGSGGGNLDKRMKNVMSYVTKAAGANEFAGLTDEQREMVIEGGLKNARVLLEQNPNMSEAEAAERGIRQYQKNQAVDGTRGGASSGAPASNVDDIAKRLWR